MGEKEEKIIKYLLEWAEHYFKSRDAFEKNIISIEHVNHKLIITFEGKKETIIAVPDLQYLRNMEFNENTSLITINNRKNVDCLYDNWNKLINIPSFKIYFINPFSTTEKKWIIIPYVHAKICDKGSLKLGFTAMFETVEQLTEGILKARL